jgi:hypothetical protein
MIDAMCDTELYAKPDGASGVHSSGGVQMNACFAMGGPKQAIAEVSWSVKSVQYVIYCTHSTVQYSTSFSSVP